ncbi:MAG: phosphoribosylglycinamide formyltransferase 2 [Halothiobacillus sp. 24-54-40]|jgi:phosphoribosylglycinamide formyltransferase 2|nr:formate-dependent phosphoribosylglycinamide formyltransferase [Halothiobacillaceae bacterium]OYV47642.1 MAG: phosphoribosylglycinamide formyltransferase 2 [Halothiobacillus sp. 20-53-49]OYY31434.1 MAG: phosphoribosylglycinamide formyltransferase 2 [Halothiobacillus sp. 35-54-62]OYZ85436.1 MAG: phosphoribosylglycinamide formyltransferase 2 [Halothiobacillus sp. 24-54-40]HQS02635.1 formate-dependent phosphoribosylglycinamide formyltransferase [Halothiobacillus sp.]
MTTQSSTPLTPHAAVLGAPHHTSAVKIMLLGSGELGKEVAIEAQRLGLWVIAVDRYANAPAMQVAQRAFVIDMLDGAALRALVEQERPSLIVPEIEAIATPTLVALEAEGWAVVPNARAAWLTMNREGIRRLAAEELHLPTSRYEFADTLPSFTAAIGKIGLPCVVKPVMSSSGKGQSVVRDGLQIQTAWDYAQAGGRAGGGRVIVESLIDFEYEITLLTIRHRDGISFCPPIGHVQIDGDYRESWQPMAMSAQALLESQRIAQNVVEALGGYGLFGVELFVRGDEVWFSEVSPRPHDTGMVTLISQDLTEFALHVRAFLGLPIPNIRSLGAAASVALLLEGHTDTPVVTGMIEALREPDTQLRWFGKPDIAGTRRMGVVLALDETTDLARAKAKRAAANIRLVLPD